MGRVTDAILRNKVKIIIGLVASALAAFLTIRHYSRKGEIIEAKLGNLTKEQRIIVFELREKRMSDKEIDAYIGLLNRILSQINSIKKLINKGEYTRASNVIINVKEDIVRLEKTKTFGTGELREQVDELRVLLGEKIKGE